MERFAENTILDWWSYFIGNLEKAMFYAEYQSLNSDGNSLKGIVLLAEWVSCAKRTLARMLVIIVSLGFGVVK